MPLLGDLGTRLDGADVEIDKPGRRSRTNGIGPGLKMGFGKWCLVSVAFRLVGMAAIAWPQVPYWIFVASDMASWQLMWPASAPAGKKTGGWGGRCRLRAGR